MNPQEIHRVPTYVAGLDERMGGGIPKGHVVLVTGPAGSMKSSLAYAILRQNAARFGTPVLYVSLEQNRASLIRQMRGMGLTDPPASSWGLVDVATIGKESGEASRSVWMDLFWRVLRSRRRLQPYEILALDSLDALELIARYPSGRDETFGLFDALRQDGVTSLVVSESTENGGVSRGRERLGAAYLADGVISLTMEPRLEGPLQRRVRVVKMRGTAHETRFFPFAFESGAFALSEPPGG